MDKISFPEDIKKLREEKNISQEEMAYLLSSSHRAFSGVNQVMLSHWERAKMLPSFVRRIGMASFFHVSYDFSTEEVLTVKSLSKLMNIPINHDVGYNFKISSVKHYDFDDAPDFILSSVGKVHRNLYNRDLIADANLIGKDKSQFKILCFLDGDVAIGHLIFDYSANILVSMGAIDINVRRMIFKYIHDEMSSDEYIFPAYDPAMSQFLYDLYMEPYYQKGGLIFFKGTLKTAATNPFAQGLYNESNGYFVYLRYNEQRLKKKSIEFIFHKPESD
ncbi:helix-turn-helix transcriptional regulator [Thalassomonas viridans]|uniref:Helix-turn-helix transcriptional regulator n=1 Tax=Thalassomonas viridans TaxID=137584 RepID=A0AAF0CDP3_9GAMM|nr:helix-turn-helix transcriptional regulator [Thalassomonas viridans]WDE08745.1 helix-turn-helix transcriptional regulator [Thalassomonas viridans]